MHLPNQPFQLLVAGPEADVQRGPLTAPQHDVGRERDRQLVVPDQIRLQHLGHDHDQAFGNGHRQVGPVHHVRLDAVAVGETVDRGAHAGRRDACAGVAHQRRDRGLAALGHQCVGDLLGYAGPARDGFLLR